MRLRRRPDRRRPAILTLGVLGLLAACGSSSSTDVVTEPTVAPTVGDVVPEQTPTSEPAPEEPTATPEPAVEIDAAELVDLDTAAEILGEGAALDSTPGPDFGATSVTTWITPEGAQLVVTVFEGREFYGGSAVRPDAQPIDIGDEGVITIEETFGGVVIEFVKGETVVSLSAVPFGVTDVEGLPAAMTAAAEEAAARLP